MNGCVFPLEEQQNIAALVHRSGVMLHLDGARIWNAMTSTGLSLQEITSPFDSVSLCFSKGLGAPAGSVLVGNRQFIKKARHFRKLYGGGMRQIGLLAAACDYSLENHFPLLLDDHKKALKLASELVKIGYTLTKPCETNMVWVDTSMLGEGFESEIFCKELAKHGIIVFGGQSHEIRLVVHHQITEEVIDQTIVVFKSIFNQSA
jgi:threonine aldolase